MKALMIKTLAVVLPCAAAGLVVYATNARSDVPSLPAKPVQQVDVTFNGSTFTFSAYASGDILAVWPVPAFKADPKTGFVAVHHEPPRLPGDLAKVSVQVVMNPSPLLKAAQAEIAAREGKALPKLSSVVLREVTVEEQPGKQKPLFEKFSLPGESSGSGEYTLVAWMPEAEAKAYADDLRTGKRHSEFRIQAKLYAIRETAKAIAAARVAKIKDTNAFTKLDGKGGPAEIEKKGDTVSQTAAPMTRGQQQELTAKVGEEIALALQITGNPKQLDILKAQVAEFMKSQAFGKERQVDLNVAELAKISPYGFDPNDLKPDVIEKFVADVKNKLEDEKQDKFTIAVGGSGYGISANASFTKEELKKKLEDKGWNFQQEGKKFIPKSVSVSDMNRQNIQAHVGFSITLDESDYSTVNFNQQVTTRARIAVSPEAESKLAQLHQQKAKLKLALDAELDKVEKARTDLKVIVACADTERKKVNDAYAATVSFMELSGYWGGFVGYLNHAKDIWKYDCPDGSCKKSWAENQEKENAKATQSKAVIAAGNDLIGKTMANAVTTDGAQATHLSEVRRLHGEIDKVTQEILSVLAR